MEESGNDCRMRCVAEKITGERETEIIIKKKEKSGGHSTSLEYQKLTWRRRPMKSSISTCVLCFDRLSKIIHTSGKMEHSRNDEEIKSWWKVVGFKSFTHSLARIWIQLVFFLKNRRRPIAKATKLEMTGIRLLYRKYFHNKIWSTLPFFFFRI